VKQVKLFKKERESLIDSGELKKRDYEILEFVLEMKFASLEDIYNKFFKKRLNGEESKSDWWARDRVYKLKKLGLLRSVKFFSESRAFYMATYDAYHLLSELYPLNFYCKPTRDIDVRTFYHDWLVTKCRIEMEENDVAKSWVSEKVLKTKESINFGIAKKYMPDGCYVNSAGENVAFELELTLKSISRYRNKVKLYTSLINRTKHNDSFRFEKCLFVCRRKTVADHLRRQILPYGNLFSIQMLSDFEAGERLERGSQ
jgi:hypothetical protein